MQSNHRFHTCTLSYGMSKFRKIGQFFPTIKLFKIDQKLCIFQTLSHCELITDEGIRQLAAGSCAAESLSVLELDNCPLITDLTLEHLVSCHNLQRIELYDCQMITRAAIRRLRVNTSRYFHSDMLIFVSLQNHLPNIKVHAYFAPVTPPPITGGQRPRYCRCCEIL